MADLTVVSKARADALKALLTAAGCKDVAKLDWSTETNLKRNVLDVHSISDAQWKVAGGTL